MKTSSRILLYALLLLPLPGMAAENRWIDSLTASIGEDKNSNQTDVYRVGLQNRWIMMFMKAAASQITSTSSATGM